MPLFVVTKVCNWLRGQLLPVFRAIAGNKQTIWSAIGLDRAEYPSLVGGDKNHVGRIWTSVTVCLLPGLASVRSYQQKSCVSVHADPKCELQPSVNGVGKRNSRYVDFEL